MDRGLILDEIDSYIQGIGHVSKATVIKDGQHGLSLLSQTKAKLSSMIDRLAKT
jgi:hypothetical protein